MLSFPDPASPPPARVVVLGAGGFIGGAIRRRLEAIGLPVLPLGRPHLDLLRDDAADRLAALLGPGDAVVAVSAFAPVKSLAMLHANLAMLRAMVAAFERVPPAHLLAISSDAVFADLPTPLTELSPKAPGSLHGVMHLTREIAFAEFSAAHAVPLAVLRPTLVYGADDPHDGYGPNRFRRLALAGQDIVLFGEGEERRDHVLIDDVAELAVRIILQRALGSLNAATGAVWSFRDVAAMVASHAPVPVRVLGSPRRGPMPHGGFRPFDATATAAAFPDFRYTQLPEGLARLAALPEVRRDA